MNEMIRLHDAMNEKKNSVVDTYHKYKDKAEQYREFEERYNEIAEQLYELMGDYYILFKDYEKVWAIPSEYERYYGANVNLYYAKYYKLYNTLFSKLDSGIGSLNLGEQSIPTIPVMEYMLVPTGNVLMYTYHEKFRDQTLQRKREYGLEKRRKHFEEKQDENYIKRKEDFENGKGPRS